jgi:hypothetical protein
MMWVGANEKSQRIRAVRHRDFDNHFYRDDDMTQDIVLQLVDRTTGCSKIKLERRKKKAILLAKQGEQNGESKDSFY